MLETLIWLFVPMQILPPASVGDWIQCFAWAFLAIQLTWWLVRYSLRRGEMAFAWPWIASYCWLVIGIGAFGRGAGVTGVLCLACFFWDRSDAARRAKAWQERIKAQEAQRRQSIRLANLRRPTGIEGFNLPTARPRRPARPLSDAELDAIARAVARRRF